jgi:WD40 repeat protein
VRKLNKNATQASKGKGGTAEVKSFQFDNILADTHFSPSGTHLVSAARRINDGMGIIHIYPWQSGDIDADGQTFVGHTGPIYALKFSPDGKTLFLSVQHPGEKTKDLQKPTSQWPHQLKGGPKSSVVQVFL